MKTPRAANSKTLLLADRIRIARRRAKLSQSALAKLAGVTPSAVAQWENPHGTRPGLHHLMCVATAAEVTLDWLITGHQSQPAKKSRVIEQESAAVVLDVFAQNPLEEALLAGVRVLRPRARAILVSLIQEWVDELAVPSRQRR